MGQTHFYPVSLDHLTTVTKTINFKALLNNTSV